MTSVSYPTQRMMLPSKNDPILQKISSVRNKDGKFQVYSGAVEVVMPIGEPLEEWFDKVRRDAKGLDNPEIIRRRAEDSEYEDEDIIEVSGWYEPTPEQLAVIEEEFTAN